MSSLGSGLSLLRGSLNSHGFRQEFLLEGPILLRHQGILDGLPVVGDFRRQQTVHDVRGDLIQIIAGFACEGRIFCTHDITHECAHNLGTR